MMDEYNEYQEEMEENPDAYGTPDSELLKEIRDAGFKPIAITVMMCEETFIFKGRGWWYGLDDFWKDWEDYHKQMGNYDRDEVDDAIYWLDKNFKLK